MMGDVLKTANPFLYPCTVQYSIIAAGILWITWRNIGRFMRADLISDSPEHGEDKKRLRVQVDCAGSNRGLFLGLFVLVAALVCLIVFYVLVQRPRLLASALTLAYSTDVALYILTGGATIVAFFKMQDMLFHADSGPGCGRELLDNLLLFLGLLGIYVYSLCSILAARTLSAPLLLTSSVLALGQSSLQSLFMCTGLKRMSYKAIHEKEKPGREFIIFLLLSNLAMWILHVFEHMRTEPVRLQSRLFGALSWAYISQLTLPLVIFYRFHSAVCLSTIWKNAYKFKTR